MTVFKCKMCGGDLEIQGQSVAECQYCGTQQTLPKLSDGRRTQMYERANHFRRSNEYDKAMGIYEQILNEDGTDAEAYWSLVLCRYGIEYVEDPASHKRIPTVNRVQHTSVFADGDYKAALQYADGAQRILYEEEAETIDSIQKGYLAISQKEEPFDVFICYKETDDRGQRTQDSVLAQDLYYGLTDAGFKVFFSRITLENKLGSAYEPYIFAALNSAKVMVVIGTRPEYFNAVWVKNEWSRYLAMIRNGEKKMLIPAYRGIDPYDMPEEFSYLQSQDMSKLGFMQDLIRGIRKIAGEKGVAPSGQSRERSSVTAAPAAVSVPGAGDPIAPLLRRVDLFLEDEDWQSADAYCEKILDRDPENARAYLGKLMAELRVKSESELVNLAQPFDTNNNYRKTLRFSDEAYQETLRGYNESILRRNEEQARREAYDAAVTAMNSASGSAGYATAYEKFSDLGEYQDSAELARKCWDLRCQKAEEEHQNTMRAGIQKMNEATYANALAKFNEAMRIFRDISGWKNADALAEQCRLVLAALADQMRRERELMNVLQGADRIKPKELIRRVKELAIDDANLPPHLRAYPVLVCVHSTSNPMGLANGSTYICTVAGEHFSRTIRIIAGPKSIYGGMFAPVGNYYTCHVRAYGWEDTSCSQTPAGESDSAPFDITSGVTELGCGRGGLLSKIKIDVSQY